jgi:hypothetical protein
MVKKRILQIITRSDWAGGQKVLYSMDKGFCTDCFFLSIVLRWFVLRCITQHILIMFSKYLTLGREAW